MKDYGYNLLAPNRVYVLPGVLKEISGITERDNESIVCIEDNRETIFIYDIVNNKIIREIEVGGRGDFEGVARVENTLYILRSDGLISEIEDYESVNYKKNTYTTGIPWKDNEGLCYDSKNNRLLIGPKEIPGKKSVNRKLRFIYGFSLDSKELVQKPVFTYDLRVVERFAIENNVKVPLKVKKKKKKLKPDIRFHISALGIHPITGRLFVLSCRKDKLLFVFDMAGNIEYIERLNTDLFRQPEGITFTKNGDMYISNEGKKRKNLPTILMFSYLGTNQ